MLVVAAFIAVVPHGQAQTPTPKTAAPTGTPKSKKEDAPPLEFLPADQLPPAAKYAGPEDPDYVAWSK